MCTLFSSLTAGFLAKNRDKNEPTEEEVLEDDNVIAVRTKGGNYYGLGLNKFGCGFVSAAVNSPAWTQLAETGKIEAARETYRLENFGLTSPTKFVSTLLATEKTITPLVDAFLSGLEKFVGYNILLMDQERAVWLETRGGETHLVELSEEQVVTNHFASIPFGPKNYEDYPSSFSRSALASTELCVGGTDKLFSLLLPGGTVGDQIWRYGNFFTVSSSILDLKNRRLHYCGQSESEYRTFQFS
ncbi:MAG: hypothetical protein CBD27_01675 [Rhodospirillaceae bacterium TMED167]|nr:MAG: hypothetical protein CBD27_01675 [Rhodospirillaceae bacterium TMED167]